jgi:hypothetical protein
MSLGKKSYVEATTMDDVVCERRYQMVLAGEATPFMVRWAKPASDPRGDWNCSYRIDWPHRPTVCRQAFGVDSVQALHLATMNVASELYTSEPPVFWREPDDMLGLPVASAIAHIEAARTKGRS